MTKLVAVAAQADADLCNALELPSKGCQAGGGLQLTIPIDWQARVAAGQDVPGCTYAKPIAGSLYVDDFTQQQLAIPAVISALTAPQQAQAAALNAKLATATTVASAQVAQAQQEVTP